MARYALVANLIVSLTQEIYEKVIEGQWSKEAEWKLVLMQSLSVQYSDQISVVSRSPSTCVLIYIDFAALVSYQINPSIQLLKSRSKRFNFLYSPTNFENKISQRKLNRRLSSGCSLWSCLSPLKQFDLVTNKEWNAMIEIYPCSYRQGNVDRVFWFERVSIWISIKHSTFVIESFTVHVSYCVWFLSLDHLLDLSYSNLCLKHRW